MRTIDELYRTMRVVKTKQGAFVVEANDAERKKYRFLRLGTFIPEHDPLWSMAEMETEQDADDLRQRLRRRCRQTDALLADLRNKTHEPVALKIVLSLDNYVLYENHRVLDWLFCSEMLRERVDEIKRAD
ncbi:MAG TPA: hypothetical protein VLH56_07425, partial [Dissulfurispiraceae bacterium]|nr:hypothetical protein [Dissulfurispiraceae bacterium]